MTLAFELNGKREVSLEIEPRETLAEVLRNRLRLTGTKISCEAQVCGSCTVLVDGLPVRTCPPDGSSHPKATTKLFASEEELISPFACPILHCGAAGMILHCRACSA